ncbi:MAG: AAA family ATPase [Candidatus Dadabacteria bacterium]|nr:AAA family ATPase [Candidatus Dadabacteria bacterium]NIS08196.1 AAA family ATPase [Candidatus Dadabacteria bacterium]NIV41442.1 AAA family ATPase [Candidatus Dadabacteria bacterium]NIY21686.1 AAA family ATPase [Candidatus Dadabacteria bacterium]
MAFPKENLTNLIRAQYPVIYLVSWEEERIEDNLNSLKDEIYGEDGSFYSWSTTKGLLNGGSKIEGSEDIQKALDFAIESNEKAIFYIRDFHHIINDPKIIRKIKDVYAAFRNTNKTLFIVSPALVLPYELEKEVNVIDVDLPDADETREIFEKTLAAIGNETLTHSFTPELKNDCINALLGLAAIEIELAVKRVLVNKTSIDRSIIEELLEEKVQIIRKSGTLEFVRSNIVLDGVGGLENIKEWLYTRHLAFSSEAKDFGLDFPNGMLIMGISGCGKSLCSKAVSTAWNLPLIRLELNQVYGGAFGSPEEVFRRAIKTVEASAPCILWIDEIEAGITRSGEKTGDSPSSRIFGYFLTWMQEKQKPVFITATANQIDLLPPELLRKGRFDEIFFVTLPSRKERKEIFRIHLLNRKKDPDIFDLDSLAKNTEGLSGSEIEQAVVSGLFESFSKKKELDDTELIIAASSIVPLSTTMREEISALERWAADRAVKASK